MSLLPGTERALLRRIAVAQAEERAPSVSAAVVRDGRAVWSGGRGRVDGRAPDAGTQYRVGSITKTFVGVLVMRLRDEGLIDLNDPLDRHLPGTAVGDRTIGQLLAHSGGLAAEPPGEWWERTPGGEWDALNASLGKDAVRHRAGRRFHYTNVGFGVLGQLVAVLRRTEWTTALREEILRPLEMARTTTRPEAPHAAGLAVHPWADAVLDEPEHDAAAMAPAGQLWSTAGDMARWAAFVGGDTGGVLGPDTIAEMREPAVVEDALTWTSGYGLGIQLLRDRGMRLAGHTGSMPGFRAAVWAEPGEGIGAVVLSNSTAGIAIGGLAADLVHLVAELEPGLPAEWTPMDDPDPALLALTGPWYWGPAPYTLRLLPDGWLSLVPSAKRAPGGRFRPEGDGTWTGLDGYHQGETLRVVRRADGTVSHLDVNTFVFTREPYDPSAPVPGGLDPRGWRGDAGA
ncbi:serine hydrolase domain-containing protein [Spirillospora sp. NBC_01491]|uniref:serine hydrolase domain-containing protein n=1 Tax=Spirillospora sp. NBC_01491 TaxID=2976007 RepID=UPI002E35C845|nr:serine hydrolase domain-containing protein [Spirillospora sp. NBC_01491]